MGNIKEICSLWSAKAAANLAPNLAPIIRQNKCRRWSASASSRIKAKAETVGI